jgi:hypothetical protein
MLFNNKLISRQKSSKTFSDTFLKHYNLDYMLYLKLAATSTEQFTDLGKLKLLMAINFRLEPIYTNAQLPLQTINHLKVVKIDSKIISIK